MQIKTFVKENSFTVLLHEHELPEGTSYVMKVKKEYFFLLEVTKLSIPSNIPSNNSRGIFNRFSTERGLSRRNDGQHSSRLILVKLIDVGAVCAEGKRPNARANYSLFISKDNRESNKGERSP